LLVIAPAFNHHTYRQQLKISEHFVYNLNMHSEESTASLSRFSSVANPDSDPHLNGEYYRNNPTWHVEYSPWKAHNILRLLEKHRLNPKSICEVGCGAGEVLRQLQLKLDKECRFWGYDVAPQAIDLAKQRQNERLVFETADLGELDTPGFDLMLALEVVDHVEDYLGFLRMLKSRSTWKIFSFSLDISAQSALRKGALLQRRVVHSHRHHFNKETALRTLEETGFEIVDFCYPPNLAFSSKARLGKPLRWLTFNMNPDLAVRLFGGYSLLVLAR
jgi:Methyltransferase domain